MDNYNEKREGSVRRIGAAEEPRSQETRAVNAAAVRAARRAEESRRRPSRRRGLDKFVIYLMIDVVAIAVFLLTFAYLHHVNPIFTKLDEPMQLPVQEQMEEPPVVEEPVVDEPAVDEPVAYDPQP